MKEPYSSETRAEPWSSADGALDSD